MCCNMIFTKTGRKIPEVLLIFQILKRISSGRFVRLKSGKMRCELVSYLFLSIIK